MFGAETLPVKPLSSIGKLPSYAFQFFFRNLHGFRVVFGVLTAVSILSASLGFLASFLLGQLITDLSVQPAATPVLWYASWYAAILVLREALDFSIRRYGEAFATIYGDHLRLRFMRTMMSARYHLLQNVLPERVQALVGRYAGNVEAFLNEWFWGVSRRMVSFLLVLVTLAAQDSNVLLANVAFMSFFLLLAFSISGRFAPIAARYSESSLESSAVSSNISMHLASLLRLGRVAFFLGLARGALGQKWQAYNEVRRFHAWRWLIQLNLFNVMYAGTLFYGALQVVQGTLALGYLVLVRYAFDRLWDVLVYVIEYYVSLVQQREDSALVRRELGALFVAEGQSARLMPDRWNVLTISGAKVAFDDPRSGDRTTVGVEQFRLERGGKYGVLGPSGVGKSTLLLMILNAIEFEGRMDCDGLDVRGLRWPEGAAAMVTNRDPLFRCSVRDNVLLGRAVSDEHLARVLNGLRVSEFCSDLLVQVGDPSINFSAGQEQRIRLARALLGTDPLLLLDEPFNGIDGQTREAIIDFMREYCKERTVVMVTHHEAETRLVDTLFKFDGVRLDQGFSIARDSSRSDS